MNFNNIVFVFLIIFATFMPLQASADWVTNNSMKSGIIYGMANPDYFGGNMHGTTFYDEDTLIVFFGASWPAGKDRPAIVWEWSGSTWTENTEFINGLSDVHHLKPEIFIMDETLYMIAGTGWTGAPNGWKWSGSQWDTYNTIVNGLTDPMSEVFWDGDTLKMISSTLSNCKGWYWNGNTWISDPSIVNGIITTLPHECSGYAVYQIGNTLHLLQEDWTYSRFNGYTWDGSEWVVNNSVSSGMTYPGVYMSIEVFVLDNTYHAISGSYAGKVFTWTDGEYIAPFSTATSTPIPVIAPPPIIPTTIPTPVFVAPPEQEITIVEELMSFLITTSSWLLILLSYIGALIGRLISNGDEDGIAELIATISFHGTIGWILILLVNIIIPLITISELFSVIIFFASGLIVAILLNKE